MLNTRNIYTPVALGDHIAYSKDVVFGTYQRAFVLPLDASRMFMHQNQDVFIELDPRGMSPRIMLSNDKSGSYIAGDQRNMLPAVRGVHIVLKNYIQFRGALASKSVRYARDILNTARELNRRSKKASVFLYDTLADMRNGQESSVTLLSLVQALKATGNNAFAAPSGLVVAPASQPTDMQKRIDDYTTLIRILDVFDQPPRLAALMDNSEAVFDMFHRLAARDSQDVVASLLNTPASMLAIFDMRTRHLHEEFRRLCMQHGVKRKRDVSEVMFSARSEEEDY